ncbi:hypothetical protein ACFYZ4_25985 [Streptomyces sp. NPDC001513]|uniref:hypothetical protein n=1 Tax=Streptomyces sp. NPDC001513 TaxID=3364580 RepID=UPI003697524B
MQRQPGQEAPEPRRWAPVHPEALHCRVRPSAENVMTCGPRLIHPDLSLFRADEWRPLISTGLLADVGSALHRTPDDAEVVSDGGRAPLTPRADRHRLPDGG